MATPHEVLDPGDDVRGGVPFVKLVHPPTGGTQSAPESVVEHWAARGWELADKTEPDEPPRTGKGSGAAAWKAYAAEAGITVPEGANRDEIIAAVDDAKTGGAETPHNDDEAPSGDDHQSEED